MHEQCEAFQSILGKSNWRANPFNLSWLDQNQRSKPQSQDPIWMFGRLASAFWSILHCGRANFQFVFFWWFNTYSMPPHFIGIIFTRFFRQKRTASSIRIWIIELCSCLSQNGAALYSTRGCCIALTFCETYVLHCVCRMITLGLEIKSRMMTDQPLWRPVSSAATWWLLSLWQEGVVFCQSSGRSRSSSWTRSSSCSSLLLLLLLQQ